MGRVFEALRRANATPKSNTPKRSQTDSERRTEASGRTGLTAARQIEEQLFAGSTIMTLSDDAANSSASTAHTANVPDGLALPGGKASRDVGATLGAAGATRSGGFAACDISPARVEPHLVAINQPRSAYCEQFRSLRARILQVGERTQMRAFVITSAGVGEGKTLTALNLAWLLAQSEGVRALLIDSDLRQPCVADYLGIETPIGLSDVLGGTTRFEDAIVRLEPAGLHLLPGGRAREDVAELLSGPTYAHLLSEARRMFDYVIIDAPPLGIFSDANVLIGRADGALVVVRAGKTRYAVLDKLLEQLPRERLMGIVLNRTEGPFESSAYYYRHRYYHRNSSEGEMSKKPLPPEREEEVVVAS